MARARKLTDEQVREMRFAHAAGETCSALARRFGVTQRHVWDVVHGFRREGAGGPIADAPVPRQYRWRSARRGIR